jgi:hypothetical protein
MFISLKPKSLFESLKGYVKSKTFNALLVAAPDSYFARLVYGKLCLVLQSIES